MGVYGLLSFPTSASPLSLSTKRHRSTKNKWVKDGNQMAMGLLLVLRDQAQFPSCIASHLLALVWLGCLFEFPLDFKMNQEVLGCRLELLFNVSVHPVPSGGPQITGRLPVALCCTARGVSRKNCTSPQTSNLPRCYHV